MAFLDKKGVERLWDNISRRLLKKADKEYVDNAVANAVGVSSWNDLTDKPFGETIPPITWDGDIEGREPAEGIQGYKVSDQFIEPETFVGAVFTFKNGDTYTVQEDDVNIMSDGSYIIGYAPKGIGVVLCTPNDAIESKGLYLYCWPNSQEYLAKIEFPVKTLDDKFIPDTIARKSDIQAMIGNAIGGSY